MRYETSTPASSAEREIESESESERERERERNDRKIRDGGERITKTSKLGHEKLVREVCLNIMRGSCAQR